MFEQNCPLSSTGVFFAVLGVLVFTSSFLIAFISFIGFNRLKSYAVVLEVELSKAQRDLHKAKTDATDTQKQLKESRLRLHASVEEAKILRGRVERLQVHYKSKMDDLEKTRAEELASHTTLTSSLANEFKAAKATISSQSSQLAALRVRIVSQAEELEVTKETLRSQASQIFADQRTIASYVQHLNIANVTIDYQARNLSCLHRGMYFQRAAGQAWKEIHADEVMALQKTIRAREEENEGLKARMGELEEVIWVLGGKRVEPWRGGEDEDKWEEEGGEEEKGGRNEKSENEEEKSEEENGDYEKESDFEANTPDSDSELDGWGQGYDCDEESEGDGERVSENDEQDDIVERDEEESDEDLVLV